MRTLHTRGSWPGLAALTDFISGQVAEVVAAGATRVVIDACDRYFLAYPYDEHDNPCRLAAQRYLDMVANGDDGGIALAPTFPDSPHPRYYAIVQEEEFSAAGHS